MLTADPATPKDADTTANYDLHYNLQIAGLSSHNLISSSCRVTARIKFEGFH